MQTLSGKTLLITGASRGIGRAIALRAAQDGANIAVVAKSAVANPKLPGTIHSVAEEVRAAGGQALAIQCDIREEDEVKAAVAAAVEEDGVYIDPTARIRYAPEDEERFARLVGESEEPVAVVVMSIERTDEFRGEQTAFELALFDRIPQDTTLILVGDGFVRYERYDAISDFTSGEQELRERTDDLPPPRVVGEYLLALPRIEWYEGMDLESEARRLYEADAEDYEPGPFPGTPEYLDRVRTSVIVLGATVFVVLGLSLIHISEPTRRS